MNIIRNWIWWFVCVGIVWNFVRVLLAIFCLFIGIGAIVGCLPLSIIANIIWFLFNILIYDNEVSEYYPGITYFNYFPLISEICWTLLFNGLG